MTLTGISSTDRIHCFSGKEGRINSVIVRGQRGTVVVDTQVTLEDGEELRRVAESMSGARPILYVLITHEHFDHIAGNQFLTCDIISSRKARDDEAWLRYCEARCIPSQRRDGFLAAVRKIYATGEMQRG